VLIKFRNQTNLNITKFTSKVEDNKSAVEDWEEFLRVMDNYLKKGVKATILDYNENEEESMLYQYYDILRKVFEEPEKNPLPNAINKDSKLKKALKLVYEKCGDLVAQMEMKDSKNITNAISTLRQKASIVQKELVKLLTILAMTTLINFSSDGKDFNSQVKSDNNKILKKQIYLN